MTGPDADEDENDSDDDELPGKQARPAHHRLRPEGEGHLCELRGHSRDDTNVSSGDNRDDTNVSSEDSRDDTNVSSEGTTGMIQMCAQGAQQG